MEENSHLSSNENPCFRDKDHVIVRKIFLNIFIVTFIIMVYVYLSEVFGSISSYYIISSEFSIEFSLTLLVFAFLSFLAGSYLGAISGVMGEILIHLMVYKQIYFEWCLIVGIFGLLCGIYKYKPLKYQDKMKIYYTFIWLIISSFILLIFITIFQVLYFSENTSIETIVLNFGFKFLMQSLISTVFIVPLLLFAYDKFFASRERHVYNMLLTHHPISACDHTYYFKFGRTKFYLCSRCSGIIIGGLLALFFTHMVESIYSIEFNPELAVIFCIILPIPGLIDWGTQRLMLRKSTTESRLMTGFIIGNALHFLSFTYKYYLFMFFLVTFYFSIMFMLMYLGHKKEMKIFEKELDQMSAEENIE